MGSFLGPSSGRKSWKISCLRLKATASERMSMILMDPGRERGTADLLDELYFASPFGFGKGPSEGRRANSAAMMLSLYSGCDVERSRRDESNNEGWRKTSKRSGSDRHDLEGRIAGVCWQRSRASRYKLIVPGDERQEMLISRHHEHVLVYAVYCVCTKRGERKPWKHSQGLVWGHAGTTRAQRAD